MKDNKVAAPRLQLSEEVASYLRQAIMAGEYAPAESIRAEALGEQLAISATPVREALQALRAEGFLDLVPRRGFTVAPLVAQDIRDLFVAHALIAGELAARAATSATEQHISELTTLHYKLLEAAARDDHDALELINHHFHRLIYRMAGSNRLHWALGIFAKYVPRQFYSQIEGWPNTTAEDHSALLESIAAGDSEAARAAMIQHIENSGELLATNFDRRSVQHEQVAAAN